MKEIHFFASIYDMNMWVAEKDLWVEEHDLWVEEHDYKVNVAYDYNRMERLRKTMNEIDGDITIATIQMSFLSTEWFESGYRIFVHDRTGIFEIVLGDGNERTSRSLRLGHSLFRLWAGGEFGLKEEEE